MTYNVDPVLITPDMYDTHACVICKNCTYFTDKGTYGLAVPLDGSAVYSMHCNKCGGDYAYIDLCYSKHKDEIQFNECLEYKGGNQHDNGGRSKRKRNDLL